MFPAFTRGDFIPGTVTDCSALTGSSALLSYPQLLTLTSRSPHPSESAESGLLVMRLVSVTLSVRMQSGFSAITVVDDDSFTIDTGVTAITQIRMRHCRSGRPPLSLSLML